MIYQLISKERIRKDNDLLIFEEKIWETKNIKELIFHKTYREEKENRENVSYYIKGETR